MRKGRDRKIKPVSFSLISEHDVRLLEYAENKKRGNFSQYVKRLIADDIAKSAVPIVNEVIAPKLPIVESAEQEALEREAMKGFL